MASMSEPMSDALFGADGTQAPEPLPDPLSGLGRGTWRDAPELPIFLPPVPDESALRAAIAAVLGDDAGAPAGAVKQDQPAAPAPQADAQAAGQPTPGDVEVPDPPKANVPKADVPKADVPKADVPKADIPGVSPPRRPPVSALIPPAPSRPRRPPGLRYRPPMAGASLESMPGADLRRRIRREHAHLPLQSRSDGGATAFFLVILIIIGLLVYFIITGFIDFVSSFLP